MARQPNRRPPPPRRPRRKKKKKGDPLVLIVAVVSAVIIFLFAGIVAYLQLTKPRPGSDKSPLATEMAEGRWKKLCYLAGPGTNVAEGRCGQPMRVAWMVYLVSIEKADRLVAYFEPGTTPRPPIVIQLRRPVEWGTRIERFIGQWVRVHGAARRISDGSVEITAAAILSFPYMLDAPRGGDLFSELTETEFWERCRTNPERRYEKRCRDKRVVWDVTLREIAGEQVTFGLVDGAPLHLRGQLAAPPPWTGSGTVPTGQTVRIFGTLGPRIKTVEGTAVLLESPYVVSLPWGPGRKQ